MAPECGCISDEYMKHSLLSCCMCAGKPNAHKGQHTYFSHCATASTNDISDTGVIKLNFFQKAVLMQYQSVAETS